MATTSLPALKGEAEWPRHEFIYWTDDGNVAALRYDDWKITFLRQNAEGLAVWQDPFDVLRAPVLANLRMDPFERAAEEHAMGYDRLFHRPCVRDRPRGGLRRHLAAELPRVSRRARSRGASTSSG